jgi:hypothetical protein
MVTIDLQEAGKERQTRAANNPYMAPKTADIELSLLIMGMNPPVPQQCWKNSFLAYNDARHAAEPDRIFYVEGQLLMPFKSGGAMAIEHAWLETEDGRVIETTLQEAAAGEEGWTYYTGLRLTMEEVLEWLVVNRSLLPLMPAAPRMPDFDRIGRNAQAALTAAYYEAWGVNIEDVLGLRTRLAAEQD